MATKATFEADAVSKSRSGRGEGLHRTRVSGGTGTKEYRAIKRHSTTIIDNLGSTVSDPARFARVLKDKSLVTDDIVDAASVLGTTLTGSQKIAPIIKAVLAQIELKANLFHKFMAVLRRENSCLEGKLQQSYLLELNSVEVVTGVSEWEELGHQLGISPVKITQLVEDGGDTEHCREEVVLEWLKGDNTASWEKLCEALERMGKKDEVRIINERYLQAQVPTEDASDHGSSPRAPPPDSSSSPLDGPHLQPALNPPQLEGSLTTGDLSIEQLTRRNQRKMKAIFYGLVSQISTTLSERMSMESDIKCGESKFRQFREYVAGVCNDSSIQSKITIEEIFGWIRDKKYWDLNGDPYDLLLTIMERVEDEKLMDSVETAQGNYYTQYLFVTKIVHHLLYNTAVELKEYRPNFSRLSMKLEKINVNERSMSYVTELWKAVKRYLNLPNLFSVLASIDKGCLCVTWLVPVYAVPAFIKLPRSSKMFSKYSIIRMTINEVCFFEVTSATLKALQGDDEDATSLPSASSPQMPLSPPQMPLPSAAPGGYDVQVVPNTRPVYDSHTHDCLICHLVLRDPIQVRCCGKRFCESCITPIKAERNVCPHCQSEGDAFQWFKDEAQRQTIMELKIYCSNQKQGCDWFGELCHLTNHLNSDPSKNSDSQRCQFSPYSCPYCSFYSASYGDYTVHHEPKCEMFPVSCPLCGVEVPRKNLHLHKTECVKWNSSLGQKTSIIADDVRNFEIRFYDLVRSVQNEMLRAQVSVVDLLDTLTLLPTSIRTEHYQFIKKCIDDLMKTEDISDIFRRLNLYWTYLEYSLLDHIIVCHSDIFSVELKEKMRLYNYDMIAFKKSTTVKQLMEIGLGVIRLEPPPGFSRFVRQIPYYNTDFTLENLDNVRRRIGIELNLPSFILMLQSVERG